VTRGRRARSLENSQQTCDDAYVHLGRTNITIRGSETNFQILMRSSGGSLGKRSNLSSIVVGTTAAASFASSSDESNIAGGVGSVGRRCSGLPSRIHCARSIDVASTVSDGGRSK